MSAKCRHTLSIDVETASTIDLQSKGSLAYARDPSTIVHLVAWSVDFGEVKQRDLAAGEPFPTRLIEMLLSDDYVKMAFNAQFEIAILLRYCPLSVNQWQCTQALAQYHGYPASLAKVVPAMGLDNKYEKLKEGEELVKRYSKELKPDTTTESWRRYKAYNKQDVVAEMAIEQNLGFLPEREQKIWETTFWANWRGIGVDEHYVNGAIALRDENKITIKSKVQRLFGVANAGSRVQLLGAINETLGTDYKSLAKETLPEIRHEISNNHYSNPRVKDVLFALDSWSKINKSSLAKYDVIKEANYGGRLYTGCTYYGAGQTGRWASYGIQLHNLPRQELDLGTDDYAAISKADADHLKFFYGDTISDVLSQGIRGSFVPKPGYVFIISDYSAIEARVLAWLADEKWRLDVFRTTGKIYEASAERMFNLTPGNVTKASPYRTRGKVAELALGYGGWVNALRTMELKTGANLHMTDAEVSELCRQWRNSNRNITKLWYKADDCAKHTIMTGQTYNLCKGIKTKLCGNDLHIELPSGRDLIYHDVEVHGLDSKTDIRFRRPLSSGKMGTVHTYGAKLIENIDQALSRDCLAESHLRFHDAKLDLLFHVHDENIVEVDKDCAEETLAKVEKLMTDPIDWAPGLELGVASQIAERYMK